MHTCHLLIFPEFLVWFDSVGPGLVWLISIISIISISFPFRQVRDISMCLDILMLWGLRNWHWVPSWALNKRVCVAQMNEIIQLRLGICSDVQSVLTVGYVALHVLVLAVKAKSWTTSQAEKSIKEHDFLGTGKLILKPLKEEDIKMYIVVVLAIRINIFDSGVQSNVLLQSWPSPGCRCNCSNTLTQGENRSSSLSQVV